MKQLDFLERLKDTLDQVTLPNDISEFHLGMLKDDPSIAIIPQPSGEEQVYFGGKRNKVYNIGILMKHPYDGVCNDVLTNVYQFLEQTKDLPSSNDSYEFVSLRTTNLPNKVGHDDFSNQVWSADFAITITIYKGVL